MRILVCGDRFWTSSGVMSRVLLDHFKPGDTLIHGDARGADRLASKICAGMEGVDIEGYPADWKQFGRAAGPIRNQKMLDEGKPDLVIAFHKNLEQSRGTKDMVNRATKKGVKVIVISE